MNISTRLSGEGNSNYRFCTVPVIASRLRRSNPALFIFRIASAASFLAALAMTKNNNLKCTLISLLLLLLASCSHNEIFFEYHSFKKEGWDRKDAAVFHINTGNTTDLFDVLLNIRNNNDYPFRNLWLFVDFQTPGGNVRTDTIKVDLADNYGKWYGKGISLYSLMVPYKTDIRFQQEGTYTYSIRQGMSENPLKGISDIGLKISKKAD